MKTRGLGAMKWVVVCLVAVGLLSGAAFAADKLVVKDGATPANTVFVVTDGGNVGVGMGAPAYKGHFSAGAAVTAPGAYGPATSQLNFAPGGTNETGGWLTAVGDNNFFVSSGAAWVNGAWVQKDPAGRAVVAGSGNAGYRVFLTQGVALGGTIALGAPKLHINYAGEMGISTGAVAGKAITTGTGAYLSAGGVWTDGSSRDYKDNIRELSASEASQALKELNPVRFSYKTDPAEQHVGFIAEDVPSLVATNDRKGLSPMDIVAVLTKVVKEQNETIQGLTDKMGKLERELARLKSRDMVSTVQQ